MKKIWLFVIIMYLVQSLSFAQKVPKSKKQKTEPEYTIELYSAFKNAKTYPLSFVADEIKYIPLEKTKDCLLGDYLQNIFFDDENIFVFDFECCYRFSNEGKFINKIGKKGRSPGEYNRPMQVAIDNKQEAIYFQDRKRILKYNYNGKFLKELQTGVTSCNLLQYEDGVFLLNDMFYQYADPGKRFSIRFFSEKEEKQIAKIDCPKKDKIPFAIDLPNMYHFDGKVFVRDYWDNTIFKVENHLVLSSYATINTGKLKQRDKDDKSVFRGKKNTGDELVLGISFIAETNRFITMASNKGLFFYDKIKNKTYCNKSIREKNDWFVFINDLTGGPNLRSNNFPKIRVDNNTFVTFNHAYEFFEEGINTNNKQIKELMKKLQPEDNPVLVLVKIKE